MALELKKGCIVELSDGTLHKVTVVRCHQADIWLTLSNGQIVGAQWSSALHKYTYSKQVVSIS